MNNVSAATAAAAAGVSAEALEQFQESGRSEKKINLAALAQTAGLDPKKFEAIAGGWRPAPKDLPKWRELRVFTTAGEGLTVNCYLVWDEATRDAALFDTGLDAQPVLEVIAAEGLKLRHIFLTHSHWDHIEALPKIRAAHPKALVHTSSPSAPPNQRNKEAEIVHVGGLRVTHRLTPGHAEDGVTYLVGNWPGDMPHAAFVGDAIFAGSMGRGNQSWTLAQKSVREQILTLPADALLCPGHGPLTTVAEERAHNPFF